MTRYHMQASKLIDGVYLYHSDKYPNYLIGEKGEVYSLRWKRFMKLTVNKDGYLFGGINGKVLQNHRVVAFTFLHNAENYQVVNHLDGCKSNNYVDNLEWCTSLENTLHAIETGIHTAKLSPVKVRAIRILKEEMTYKELSKMFDVSEWTLKEAVNGRSWKHVI